MWHFRGAGEGHAYSPMHQAGLASNNAKAAQVGGLGSLREEACKGGGTEGLLAQGSLRQELSGCVCVRVQINGVFLMSPTFPGVTEELPAAKTCPNMTSDTSSGATLALCRTSLMTVVPRSWTGTVDRAPLKEPMTERGREKACEPREH